MNFALVDSVEFTTTFRSLPTPSPLSSRSVLRVARNSSSWFSLVSFTLLSSSYTCRCSRLLCLRQCALSSCSSAADLAVQQVNSLIPFFLRRTHSLCPLLGEEHLRRETHLAKTVIPRTSDSVLWPSVLLTLRVPSSLWPLNPRRRSWR